MNPLNYNSVRQFGELSPGSEEEMKYAMIATKVLGILKDADHKQTSAGQ